MCEDKNGIKQVYTLDELADTLEVLEQVANDINEGEYSGVSVQGNAYARMVLLDEWCLWQSEDDERGVDPDGFFVTGVLEHVLDQLDAKADFIKSLVKETRTRLSSRKDGDS